MRHSRRFALPLLLAVVSLTLPLGARAGRPVIVQTNAAGDNIHLIDPETNKVTAVIKGIEVPHGAAGAPDGSRLYVTNESEHSLDIVDLKTLKIVNKIHLSNRPNNVAVSKDGKKVYVAIVGGAGAVDVIDTAVPRLVKSISTKGGVHNTFATPDGRHILAGSIVGQNLSVIDAKTDEIIWTMAFDAGVRPIGWDRNPDGSTKRLFVQLSDFHGFAVVDFATHKEVTRITLPELPKDQQNWNTLQGSPAHGIMESPDGKTLWSTSKVNSAVYAYSLPDLKLLGEVKVGHHPDWLTFTPDSKRLYVANAGSNSVSVVDVAARKEIMQIPVGQVPKRNTTAILP
jgi:YVTN family beta-propeller protein